MANNGNDNQIVPVIVNAVFNTVGNGITIEATAPSTPSVNYRLDFFLNTSDRSPITEGGLYLGTIETVAAGATITQFFALSSTITNGWVSAVATALDGTNYYGDSSAYTTNFTGATLPNNIPAFMFSDAF